MSKKHLAKKLIKHDEQIVAFYNQQIVKLQAANKRTMPENDDQTKSNLAHRLIAKLMAAMIFDKSAKLRSMATKQSQRF